ncbi:MAG TPA: hypothetical protein VGT02_18560 [Methylomirabilota bacterium]|jgi:hypothetical protein|nr:hypothetical protein [Methylomirabilota bacterium]
MLMEVGTRQPSRESARRWFSDDEFDLVVWFSGAAIVGFELCYDKPGLERAVTWNEAAGYGHFRVDSGEPSPLKNLTPILARDGVFPKDRVVAGFLAAAAHVEPALRAFVAARREAYPAVS